MTAPKRLRGEARFREEWVRLGDIQVHPKVQRPLNKERVQYLVENFDPDLFDLPWVVPAPRDGHWVFRGQHRVEAAKKVLGEDQKVRCRIYDEKAPEVLARLFLGEADVLGVRLIDKWMIRRVEKDETVLKIDSMLAHHGLRVDRAEGSGVVRAVKALETLYGYDKGKATLPRTLSVLHGAWGTDPNAFDACLLRGMGVFLTEYASEVDDQDLIRKLREYGDPEGMPGQARSKAHNDGISSTRAMAAKLVNIYNKGRRVKKLEN